MDRDDRERSILAVGLDWAARITSIGLEFVLPGLIGVGLDHVWGTRPWMTICGVIIGFCIGLYELLRIASRTSDQKKPRDLRREDPKIGD